MNGFLVEEDGDSLSILYTIFLNSPQKQKWMLPQLVSLSETLTSLRLLCPLNQSTKMLVDQPPLLLLINFLQTFLQQSVDSSSIANDALLYSCKEILNKASLLVVHSLSLLSLK